jgi:hypothetical protein
MDVKKEEETPFDLNLIMISTSLSILSLCQFYLEFLFYFPVFHFPTHSFTSALIAYLLLLFAKKEYKFKSLLPIHIKFIITLMPKSIEFITFNNVNRCKKKEEKNTHFVYLKRHANTLAI